MKSPQLAANLSSMRLEEHRMSTAKEYMMSMRTSSLIHAIQTPPQQPNQSHFIQTPVSHNLENLLSNISRLKQKQLPSQQEKQLIQMMLKGFKK